MVFGNSEQRGVQCRGNRSWLPVLALLCCMSSAQAKELLLPLAELSTLAAEGNPQAQFHWASLMKTARVSAGHPGRREAGTAGRPYRVWKMRGTTLGGCM